MFFVGDSAGHCLPLSGEGIRTAFYFGIEAGRELRAVLEQRRTREQALERYAAFSRGHARAFAWALFMQRTLPRLPPRALTALLSVMGRERPCRRAFNWYLALALARACVGSLTGSLDFYARKCRSVKKSCLRSSSMPLRGSIAHRPARPRRVPRGPASAAGDR